MNRIRKNISYILFSGIIFLTSCAKEKKVEIYEHFFVPNSFSPNNDQVNETFFLIPIPGVLIPKFHISIYNENIQLVYESDDLNGQWNGYLGNTEPVSGYYEYQVLYTASTDSVHYDDYISTATVHLLQ